MLRNPDNNEYVLAGLVERGLRNCPAERRFAAYTNTTVISEWIKEKTKGVIFEPEGDKFACIKPRDNNNVEAGNVSFFRRIPNVLSAAGIHAANQNRTRQDVTNLTSPATTTKIPPTGTTAEHTTVTQSASENKMTSQLTDLPSSPTTRSNFFRAFLIADNRTPGRRGRTTTSAQVPVGTVKTTVPQNANRRVSFFSNRRIGKRSAN